MENPIGSILDALKTSIRIQIEQPPRPSDPPNAVDLDLDQAEEFVEELKRVIAIARKADQ